MKRYLIDALISIGIIGLFALNANGAEPIKVPLDGAADPTAVLLVEQGIKQFEGKQWEAARFSFVFASQIDPTLSVSSFNAGPTPLQFGQRSEALSVLEGILSSRPGFSSSQGKVGSRPASTGSGFAEFGAAGLLGFIFIFAMAAYDIGFAHLSTEKEVERFEKATRMKEQLRLKEQLQLKMAA